MVGFQSKSRTNDHCDKTVYVTCGRNIYFVESQGYSVQLKSVMLAVVHPAVRTRRSAYTLKY